MSRIVLKPLPIPGDQTSDDYPDTADWHASEEGQQERRMVATQDVDALSQFVGFGLAEARRLLKVIDGVPGVKAVICWVSPGSDHHWA